MTLISEDLKQFLSTDENKKFAENYIEVIRANLNESAVRFERRFGTLIIAIILLELITQAVVAEFSLFGLKISDLALIQKMLPVAIACLYYYFINISCYRLLLSVVHEEIFKLTHPDLNTHVLNFYAHPPFAMIVERIIIIGTGGQFGKSLDILSRPLKLVISIGPIAYLAYSFYRSFESFGFKDVIVWLSLVITIFFTVLVFFLLYGAYRLIGERQDTLP